jgi:hypothetical protein
MAVEMRFWYAPLLLAASLSSCSSEPACQNELQGRSLSPNGKKSAVIFSRNCGATVGENYQVSIVPNGEALSDKGNALVVDQAPPYSDRLKPIWNGNDSITVPIPTGSRIFSKADNVSGVWVTFKQM